MQTQEPMTGGLRLDEATQPRTLIVSGDWILEHYRVLSLAVERLKPLISGQVRVDMRRLSRLDTAGASLIVALLGSDRVGALTTDRSGISQSRLGLLSAVAALPPLSQPSPAPAHRSLREVLARIGRGVIHLGHSQVRLLSFIGQTLMTLLQLAPRPRRWRVTSLAVYIEQTGIDAVPIVALLTFLVGAVVAFLGATVLNQFGASIFTVNLVGFSFFREFGVLLAAILLAGRSASAFAAQIGSMKANEEIDAIRTLGLNPIELLVLPRLLAMMLTLPLLTFIGILSGVVGGLVVCALALDIPPILFLNILQRDIHVRNLFVGLVKAPLFAFVIALIGCQEGFKVGGSAQSVGEHTTSAVVQAIFMVILLDAVAALFFKQMGW